MKQKLFGLLALILFTVSVVSAQTRVTGVVTSKEDGSPIPFASVFVKGTNVATSTDMNGSYSINVPAGATILAFNVIGMKPIEVEIAGRTVVNVTMETDALALDDVVVIAYGTVDRRSFTGSAATVKGETITRRPISNVSKGLSGVAAGVQIASSSGQPGSSATIRVRGVGSISASQDPLIVLDGIPYDGSLASINTADIETLTVLKDAAANSMYGARGANGVIMITTKRGQVGKTRVSFEARGGFNQRGTPAYDVSRDPGQYLELVWESLRNYAADPANNIPGGNPAQWASDNLTSQAYGTGGYNPFGNLPGNQVVLPTGTLNPSAKLMYWDDWLKDPFETGYRQEYLASMSGGNNKTNFYMSLSYLSDESYVPNSDFERFTGRVKVEHSATDWFKMGMNMAYSKSKSSTTNADRNPSAFANIFMFAQQVAPIYPIYEYDQTTGAPILDEMGNRVYDYGTNMGKRNYGANTNPLAAQKHDIRNSDRDQVTAIAFTEIRFMPELKLTTNVAIENYNQFSNSFQTPIGGDAKNVGGRNYRGSSKYFVVNSQQLLNYNKSFNNIHNLDVLLGHETKSTKLNYLEGSKENFLIPGNPELDNAAKLTGATSYENNTALHSYMFRAQYNYDYKYYLNASVRRDGSSRFHPDTRWGNFWAVGASWRIEQEDFMRSYTWLDMLKFKASYGIQGNDGINRVNAYSDQYSVVNLDGEIGISYIFRGNPNLTWENSANFNIGFDFGFFDKLKGTIEYYNKYTKDLLYQKPLPGSMGSPNWIYDNAISMTNSGIEIELSYDIFKKKDLFWNITANATYQSNKLNKLPSDRDPYGYGYRFTDPDTGNTFYFKKGLTRYDWHLYEYAGVDPETGKSLWWRDIYAKDDNGDFIYDKNNNRVVESSEKTDDYSKATYRINGKSGLVDWYGGVSTSVVWKGVDLSIQTSYQIGGYGLDGQYSNLMNSMSDPGRNVHNDVIKNRWRTPGQITDVPKLQYNLQNQNAQSDRFLTSKTAFTLQNVTIGYTLPKSIAKKLDIDALRVYASGDNLLLISARKGFDPRLSIGAGSGFNYSAMRTFTLGVNLNF